MTALPAAPPPMTRDHLSLSLISVDVSDWLHDGINGFLAAARLYRERRDPAPEQKLLDLLAGASSS